MRLHTLVVAAFLLLPGGCSPESSSPSDMPADAGADAALPAPRLPPSMDGGPVPAGLTGMQFAARTTSVGTGPGESWSDVGFALPGARACRQSAATTPAQADNAFGRLVVPALAGVLGPFSGSAQDGKLSHLFLPSADALLLFPARGATTPDGVPVPVSEAEWANGGYTWYPLSVSPKAVLAAPLFSEGLIVARGTVPILLSFGGAPFRISIRNAVLAASVQPPSFAIQAGGTVAVNDLLGALPQALLRAGLKTCVPPADLTHAIAAAADILVDGTSDPTRDCDGISTGVLLSGHAAKQGATVEDFQALPCPGQ